MADKGNEAGPSNPSEDSIERSLDFTSESFDPVRALYTQNIDLADENAEIFSSVAQFERIVGVESHPTVSSASGDSSGLPSRADFETEPLIFGREQANRNHLEVMHSDSRDELEYGAARETNRVLTLNVERDLRSTTTSTTTNEDDIEMIDHYLALPVPRGAALETEPLASGPEQTRKDSIENINTDYANDGLQYEPVPGVNTDEEQTKKDVDIVCEDRGRAESGETSLLTQSVPLKMGFESSKANTDAGDKDAGTAEAEEKTTQPRRRNMIRRTILTEMKTSFDHGPLSILKRSVEERLKVRVVTRGIRNIRGISTGYVIAFDKHMNVAMIDVDEMYRKPVGKHQKKVTKPQNKAPADVQEVPPTAVPPTTEDTEPIYPKTPWQPVGKDGSGDNPSSLATDPPNPHDIDSDDQTNGRSKFSGPPDGIGDLPSAFKGMHVFDESETTRLMGAKTRRVLARHLNQVLLRGDHIVAIALVE